MSSWAPPWAPRAGACNGVRRWAAGPRPVPLLLTCATCGGRSVRATEAADATHRDEEVGSGAAPRPRHVPLVHHRAARPLARVGALLG